MSPETEIHTNEETESRRTIKFPTKNDEQEEREDDKEYRHYLRIIIGTLDPFILGIR